MRSSNKYETIPQKLFIENRKKFVAKMKSQSIAIFHSNEEHPWNGDATHAFKQNSDLFWLTGVDQEETILVLSPDCPVVEYREALFIKRTSDMMVVWNGYKLTMDEATQVSGI